MMQSRSSVALTAQVGYWRCGLVLRQSWLDMALYVMPFEQDLLHWS